MRCGGGAHNEVAAVALARVCACAPLNSDNGALYECFLSLSTQRLNVALNFNVECVIFCSSLFTVNVYPERGALSAAAK